MVESVETGKSRGVALVENDPSFLFGFHEVAEMEVGDCKQCSRFMLRRRCVGVA